MHPIYIKKYMNKKAVRKLTAFHLILINHQYHQRQS